VSSQKRREKGGKNKRHDDLSPEQRRLKKGFIEHETLRGMKNMKDRATSLKALFIYLNEGGIEACDLRIKEAQEFQTYLCSLKNENGTSYYATYSIKNIIYVATNFYNYLKEKGKVYSNPFHHIKQIKVKRRLPRNIPVEEKMNEFLEILSRFWEHDHVRERRMYYKTHVMAELMYATGMRISEVLNLKEEDIDFEEKVITVREGKGGKSRIAYLNEYAAKVLLIYCEEMKEVINFNKEKSYIFGVISKATVTSVFHKYLSIAGEKIGIGRFTAHNFRHSLGFHLLRRGCDMRYIQLILGHEDMNTTTIYTKVAKGDLRKELDTYHPRQCKSIKGKENEKV